VPGWGDDAFGQTPGMGLPGQNPAGRVFGQS